MTPAEVLALIAAGEQYSVEFKGESARPVNDADLIEAVVCLANGDGGHLLVGVEDDGRVTGAHPRHEGGVTDVQRVRAVIANRTQPSLVVDAELVALDGAGVLVVSVPRSGPLVGTRDGKYLRRGVKSDGSFECVGFQAHEILAHEIDRGALDYAALEARGARWEDLDSLEFDRLRRLIRESRGRGDAALVELSNEDIARALGVVVANHDVRAIRVGALLLFGTEEAVRRHVPTHEVAFQAFRGTSVEVNDFFRWPLYRVAEELVARFRARNIEEELQVGIVRVAMPAYPETSFREAVANALVHRDYTRLGAVHVQWHEDRLEISNPGGFPPGIELSNLLVAPPRPRSPILADAFKRAGLVERTGRGIDLIFDGQLRFGRRRPDYSRSTREGVTVILPGGPANPGVVRIVAERAGAGRDLSLADLIVLNGAVAERELTSARAGELLQVAEDGARIQLNRMVERGLLEPRGERKGRSYHLSADVYRTLGAPAAYVRVHGFDALQQEQMVLTYAQAHGGITRAQAMELCRANGAQAYRLLSRLVHRGLLLPPDPPRGRAASYAPARPKARGKARVHSE